MSYEEETTDLRAQVREFALEAAKERSLAEQATRARNTARAKVRELETELARSEQELAYHRRTTDKGILKAFDALKARAEKAEAEFKSLELGFIGETMLRKKAEARVAKLEALIQRAIGFGLGGSWEHEAATSLEAREREAAE